MPLSAEELSFFESFSQPTTTQASQPGNHNSVIQGLQALNISHAPEECINEQNNASNNDNKEDEDEDDFGDFIDPEPIESGFASSFANGSTDGLEPANVSSLTGIKGSPKEDPPLKEHLKNISTDPSSFDASLASPKKAPVVSMQTQINELGAYASDIKFGQHLITSKNILTGEIEQKPSHTSRKQWNAVLDSHYGEYSRGEALQSGAFKVNSKPIKSKSSSQPPQKQLPQLPDSKLIPEVDPWAFDDSSDHDFELIPSGNNSNIGSTSTNTFSSTNIDPPEVLLSMIRTNILPLLENFFKSLVPLSYALKKRVLARQETTDFLTAFLQCVLVACRIAAGRPKTNSKAALEATRFENDWNMLWKRLDALVPVNSTLRPFPVLISNVCFPRNTMTTHVETCKVCGLTKTELISGELRSKHSWNKDKQGHVSCIRLWENINRIDKTRSKPAQVGDAVDSLI